MSYNRRIVELMNCDCSLLGELFEDLEMTVHCENSDGQMRCEVCGKVKK